VGSLPVILGELFAFLNPALHYSEKKVIKKIVLPTISLFVTGCLFSYYVVIPYYKYLPIDYLPEYVQEQQALIVSNNKNVHGKLFFQMKIILMV